MTATNDASATASAWAQRAEVDQARMFAELLRTDIAQMTERVVKAESAWCRRCEVGGEVEPPERLKLVRSRIAEAARMLDALEARFLAKR